MRRKYASPLLALDHNTRMTDIINVLARTFIGQVKQFQSQISKKQKKNKKRRAKGIVTRKAIVNHIIEANPALTNQIILIPCKFQNWFVMCECFSNVRPTIAGSIY